MTQDAVFLLSNSILLITFRNCILIMCNWVLLMVFLLITEAAPMVIDCTGGRGEVCDCSNKSSFFGFLFGISVL